MANDDSKLPYAPVFLHPDEAGNPEPTQSVDQPKVERASRPIPGTYLEYEARLDDLRLLTPFLSELKNRLGKSCYVVEFKSSFDMDAIPSEFRHKDPPMLWKIKMPGVRGWVTDRDPKTFYFPSKVHSLHFLRQLLGDIPSQTLDETLEVRENLDKLLW